VLQGAMDRIGDSRGGGQAPEGLVVFQWRDLRRGEIIPVREGGALAAFVFGKEIKFSSKRARIRLGGELWVSVKRGGKSFLPCLGGGGGKPEEFRVDHVQWMTGVVV